MQDDCVTLDNLTCQEFWSSTEEKLVLSVPASSSLPQHYDTHLVMAAFRSDRLLVRDYITAQDHLQYSQLPDGVVAILLTHSNL